MLQLINVCFTDILKYSLKSQKPPSFRWEKIRLPAQVLITNNSGDTPEFANALESIPAVAVAATVAE